MEAKYNNPDFLRPDPGDPVEALSRVDIQPDLRVGTVAPDFELTSVDGGRVRLSDVLRERHAVLIFGAITSPVTATNLPAPLPQRTPAETPGRASLREMLRMAS